MVYSCEYCCLAESAYRREKKRGEPAKESSGYFGFSIGRTFLGLPTNVGSAKTGTASATWPRDRADSWKLMGSLHRWATTSARSRVLTANKTCKRTDHVHESELCILNNDFFFFLVFRYDERNILGTLFGKKVVVEFYFRERLLRGKKKGKKDETVRSSGISFISTHRGAYNRNNSYFLRRGKFLWTEKYYFTLQLVFLRVISMLFASYISSFIYFFLDIQIFKWLTKVIYIPINTKSQYSFHLC